MDKKDEIKRLLEKQKTQESAEVGGFVYSKGKQLPKP